MRINKLLTLVFSLVLLLSLTACGGETPATPASSSSGSNAASPTNTIANTSNAASPTDTTASDSSTSSSGSTSGRRDTSENSLLTAAGKVSNAQSYHFVYSEAAKNFSGDKTFKTNYEGDYDKAKSGATQYTLTTDDPDSKAAGEWLAFYRDGQLITYRKEAGSWVKPVGMPDFASTALTVFVSGLTGAALTTDASDPNENPKLVGSETIAGQDCDHWQVVAKGSFFKGNLDVYVGKQSGDIVQATLKTEDGSTTSLSTSKLDQPVSIELPN